MRPRRLPLQRRPALLIAVGLAAAAVGCGTASDSSVEVVAEAGAATSKVGSLAVEHECVTVAEGFELTQTAEGVVDLAADKGRLVIQLDEAGADTSMELEQEHVWDRDQTFVRVGDFGWREDTAAGDFATSDFITFGFLPLDPADQLEFLSAASDPEEIGQEKIRDVQTSGYAFELSTYDLAESADLPPEVVEEFESDPEIPIGAKVWIGDDGLARRLEFSIDFPEMPPDPAGTQTCTTDYFDFGTEVGDVLPSPEEVAASEDALLEDMNENVRLMYVAAGATDGEATCLNEALGGPDLYFSEPTSREETENRLPVEDWLQDAADCASEERLLEIRATMIEKSLAGELPDPWGELLPGN